MNAVTILELLARGAAVGAFAGLAIIVGRGGASPARLTGVLFCIAAAAHTLTQLPEVSAALGWTLAPVWFFSVMGAGLLWAFVIELFDDREKLSLTGFVPAAILFGLGLGGAFFPNPAAHGFWLLHELVGAALVLHALWVIARGWREDLVEPRRRLRGPVLVVSAIYAFAVIAVETGEIFFGSAAALSPIAAVALLLLGMLAIAAFGQADPSLFGAARRAEAHAPAEAPPLSGEDAAAAAALDRLMGQERIYREEGLTVSALALKLKLPEHRLRRLINQRLGHRSFSAFLNQWRLADAKAALADPGQSAVPISTIALDAGFGSLGPFNRAFKAETGQTPSEFRAQALRSNGSPAAKPAT
jgi:AraC-like DNA-binding protein